MHDLPNYLSSRGAFRFSTQGKTESLNLFPFVFSFFFSRFLLLPEVIIKTVQVDKTTHGLCRKRSTIIERATNTRRFTVTYNMDWKKKKKKILADSTPKTHQHEAQTREKTLSNFCFSNSFASRSLAHSVDNYLFFRITDERTRKMFSQLAIGVSRLLLVPINTWTPTFKTKSRPKVTRIVNNFKFNKVFRIEQPEEEHTRRNIQTL